MTMKLNNQSDGYYHKLFLLNEATGAYEEVKDLITAGGGGGGGGANLTGYALTNDVLSLLNGYTSTASLNTLLSGYTDTTNLNILLTSKQNNLIAGTGISLVGNKISSLHSPLVLQLNGVTQSATTLNFIQNNALLSDGVLNVTRLTH